MDVQSKHDSVFHSEEFNRPSKMMNIPKNHKNENIITEDDHETIRHPLDIIAQIRNYEIDEEDTTEGIRIRRNKTSKQIADIQGEFLSKALKPYAEYIKVNGNRPPFIDIDRILMEHLNDFFDFTESGRHLTTPPAAAEEQSSPSLKRPSSSREILPPNKKKNLCSSKSSLSPTQEVQEEEKETPRLYEPPWMIQNDYVKEKFENDAKMLAEEGYFGKLTGSKTTPMQKVQKEFFNSIEIQEEEKETSSPEYEPPWMTMQNDEVKEDGSQTDDDSAGYKPSWMMEDEDDSNMTAEEHHRGYFAKLTGNKKEEAFKKSATMQWLGESNDCDSFGEDSWMDLEGFAGEMEILPDIAPLLLSDIKYDPSEFEETSQNYPETAAKI